MTTTRDQVRDIILGFNEFKLDLEPAIDRIMMVTGRVAATDGPANPNTDTKVEGRDVTALPATNTVPIERWMLVWEHLDVAVNSPENRVAVNNLIEAVYQLAKILQPASVREIRRDM